MNDDENKTRFEKRLADERPVVIDGGLATQCEAEGCDTRGPLWSAKLIESDPEALAAAGRTFLDAGAEVITTASYQLSRLSARAAGRDAGFADALLERSVEIAAGVRDDWLDDHPDARPPLVAASVGPYGASLADGSEYRGDYRVRARRLIAFHEDRLQRLDASAADVLACETIPSYLEAQVLGELLEHVQTPAWVSFSCRDGATICDATPIEDAVDLFLGHWRVLAVGVNCTAPKYVPELIGRIRKILPGKSVIVYPNSGEHYDAQAKRWSQGDDEIDWGEAAAGWVAAGAKLVGGCCRAGPEAIAALAAAGSASRG